MRRSCSVATGSPRGRAFATRPPWIPPEGSDAFALVIAHSEDSAAGLRVVQDVMKSWGRTRSSAVDLEGVVKEIAACCRDYSCATVVGDRYGSGWVRERFRAEGLRYVEPELKRPNEPAATRYFDKSLAYLEMEPLFARGASTCSTTRSSAVS